MYYILTSKPGQFRTELTPEVTKVEAYDYVFCGRMRARFVIAQMEENAKVRIVDDAGSVNDVPSKFLPKFDSLERAREELMQLAHFGGMDIQLVKV